MSPSASETLGRTVKAMDLEELALQSGVATPSLARSGTARESLLVLLSECRGKRTGASEDTWRLVVRMLADRRRECLPCVRAGELRPGGAGHADCPHAVVVP